MANNDITIGIEYQINKSKYNEIISSLEQIQRMTSSEYMSINKGLNISEAEAKLKELNPIIQTLKTNLSEAFNANIGTVNIAKFNKEMINSKLSINQACQALKQYGAIGEAATREIVVGLATQNLQLKETHTLLDKMGQTMANTIRYGISSSIFNTMANRLQQSYEFSKQLNTSLNSIRIVSNKSANDMERFAIQANNAAKSLGATTQDYTKASLIYAQQGLSDKEIDARTNVTIKAANITGQQASEVSEQLTAVWNGYKVSAEETEQYIDKLAAVAATTASNLEELSVGMSKVASAANNAGIDVDQMNAMLSTVISVTREAPETIGTSFRTLFARMGDLKLGKTDEDGVGLGKVSSQLQSIGVQVLDQEGNMRDMGLILEDLAKKWKTLTSAQQQAAAVSIGGKMQYSRLIALMNNWDKYNEALETSREAEGTLQRQQDIYMERTEAHLQKLQAAWENIFITIFDNKGLNGLIDGLTTVVDLLGDFTKATGGGAKSLLTFGSIGMQIMNKQLTQGLGTTVGNFRAEARNKEIYAQDAASIDVIGETIKVIGDKEGILKQAKNDLKELVDARKYLTAEEYNAQKNNIYDRVTIENERALWEERKQQIIDYVNTIVDEKEKITDIDDLIILRDGDSYINDAINNIDGYFDELEANIQEFEEKQKTAGVTADELAEIYKNILDIVGHLEEANIDPFKGINSSETKKKLEDYQREKSTKDTKDIARIFSTGNEEMRKARS